MRATGRNPIATETIGGAGARMIRAHGLALEAAGRREEALTLWRDAVSMGRADALLRRALERWMAEAKDTGEAVPSPEDMEALRSLGYVE